MPKISLSVVIPVFNEEKTIEHVISMHAAVLKQKASALSRWEIVCLDDASTDQSWPILQACQKKFPQLRLLHHVKNQGISRSFAHLYQEAQEDYIYLTAADEQWPAENLARLIEVLQEHQADLVIGVRQGREKVYSWGRRILSSGFNALAKMLLKVDVKDVNGVKLGRKDIFSMPTSSKSFFSEIERLSLAQKKGYRIVYAPVLFLPRQYGVAQGARIENVVDTLKDFYQFLLKKKH